VPTDINIEPDLPLVACPVSIVILPEAPSLVVPDWNVSDPLTPFVPAFTVLIMTPPLEVAAPCPVAKEI
jgi:hypothetical protein